MTDEEFKRYQDIARAGYRMAHHDEFCTCEPMERMAAQGKAMVEAAKCCPLCKKAPEPYVDDVELPSDAPVFDPKTTVHFVPEAKLLEAQERITQLERERDEARETNRELHRRVQNIEAKDERMQQIRHLLSERDEVWRLLKEEQSLALRLEQERNDARQKLATALSTPAAVPTYEDLCGQLIKSRGEVNMLTNNRDWYKKRYESVSGILEGWAKYGREAWKRHKQVCHENNQIRKRNERLTAELLAVRIQLEAAEAKLQAGSSP